MEDVTKLEFCAGVVLTLALILGVVLMKLLVVDVDRLLLAFL